MSVADQAPASGGHVGRSLRRKEDPLLITGRGRYIDDRAAVTNAVIDALRPLAVNYINMPLSPMRVWTAIEEAKGGVPA